MKGISLYWRLFSAFLLTSLVPVIIMVFLLQGSLFGGIQELQLERIHDLLERSLVTLEEQSNQIAASVQDYAHWDEMMEQSYERDQEWLRVNITDWIPEHFHIDAVFLADRDGNVFYNYDLPEEIAGNVSAFPLFQSALRGEEPQALYLSSRGLMLVAASYVSPAFDTESVFLPEDAPAVLFYGRLLDSHVAELISESVGGHVEFFDRQALIGTSDTEKSGSLGQPWAGRREDVARAFAEGTNVDSQSDDEMSSVALLTEASGEAVGAISVSRSRDTEQFVKAEIISTMIAGIIASLIAASLLGLYLGWKIVRSLRLLTQEVVQYSEGKLTDMPEISRNDEIGVLHENFAAMVKTLDLSKQRLLEQQQTVEKSNDALRKNAVKLEKLKAELETRVEELGRLNEVMVGRELRMANLKMENERLAALTGKKPAKDEDLPLA